MFFFIALPGTLICFIAYSMIVFTPKYLNYKADVPEKMKVGAMVSDYQMGVIQNCSKNGTMTKVEKEQELVYTKWGCNLNNWKILTNQIFLAFLSTTSVAWFTLLGAFCAGLVKVVLDWVPNDKIKAARIMCSRNFGLGLMSAHITAGGFIIASTVLMIVFWKMTLASAGWTLGMNVFLGIAVAIGSFFTAIMWFMDVKKVGLIPI